MKIQEANASYKRNLLKFKIISYAYPFRAFFQKRRFHCFCLGTPKSGTHSVASLLSTFRSAHEPDEVFMINLINKWLHNKISSPEIRDILYSRDVYNWLELESSHYNGVFVEELKAIFENAKFILTMRDCISWMDSWFNHQLSRKVLSDNSIYDLGRNNYYRKGYDYTKYDSFLKEMKLFPIKSYLQFWHDHNFRIIRSVESSKLLIMKTTEISFGANKLAHFLNIDEAKINKQGSHEFKAKQKFRVLEKIDYNYLFDTSMEICGELNDKYFPEKTIKLALDSMVKT